MSESEQNNSYKQKVSVIIPIYNQEKFLAESIESVLAQTYINWELILVDDGSIDASPQIAQTFVEKYPQKIFLYTHEGKKNRGASASRNLGIKHATGDFINFLDSDDVLLPETIEIQLDAFAENPESEVVCGTLQYWFSWNEKNNKKERDFLVNLGLPSDRIYQSPTLLIHNLRSGGRKPGIGCVILQTAFAKKIKMFEDDFRYVSEDQVFWAKVGLFAKIYVTDKCFVKYRQHHLSSSSILMESGKSASDWENFLNWLENYLAENKIENKKVWQALKLCRKENNYKTKYQTLFNLYRKVLPYHLRYRIRDFIISWRIKKDK